QFGKNVTYLQLLGTVLLVSHEDGKFGHWSNLSQSSGLNWIPAAKYLAVLSFGEASFGIVCRSLELLNLPSSSFVITTPV
ncbi:hypothetical protein Q6316_29565, partial [Klebsiella pneumoniae]|uniref:hypothetical protein n=1 Tax=Klebsiella pneumoniae TaxID=573 RepID=UPI002730C537